MTDLLLEPLSLQDHEDNIDDSIDANDLKLSDIQGYIDEGKYEDLVTIFEQRRPNAKITPVVVIVKYQNELYWDQFALKDLPFTSNEYQHMCRDDAEILQYWYRYLVDVSWVGLSEPFCACDDMSLVWMGSVS